MKLKTKKNYFALSLILLAITTPLFIKQNLNLYDHYRFLSRALLKGRLDVTQEIEQDPILSKHPSAVFDYSIYQDKYFVPMGPLPAITGIALLPLGQRAYHILPITALVLINTILLSRITKSIKNYSLLITAMIIFSSPILTSFCFLGPWYVASLYVFTFSLLFVYTYLYQKKGLGILWLIPMTLVRPTTVFYGLVPVISWIIKKKINQKEFKLLCLAGLVVGVIWLGYNYLRFDHPLEFGYQYQEIPPEEFRHFRETERFSKTNFISNLIYLFFNPLRPFLNRGLRYQLPYFEISRFGVGLVYTAPWLFFPFFAKKTNLKKHLPILGAVALIITTSLLFNGEGSFQLVPRYAADWMPLAFFVVLEIARKNKSGQVFFLKLLQLGTVFNLYLWILLQLGHINRV